MYDPDLAFSILEQIHNAAQTILERFDPVKTVNDFTDTPAGLEKLDAICMQLIAIGESLKNLDKITGGDLLRLYPQVDWKKAMGLRDIITHHYFDINAEAIFNVCQTKIPLLNRVILQIITDIKHQ